MVFCKQMKSVDSEDQLIMDAPLTLSGRRPRPGQRRPGVVLLPPRGPLPLLLLFFGVAEPAAGMSEGHQKAKKIM